MQAEKQFSEQPHTWDQRRMHFSILVYVRQILDSMKTSFMLLASKRIIHTRFGRSHTPFHYFDLLSHIHIMQTEHESMHTEKVVRFDLIEVVISKPFQMSMELKEKAQFLLDAVERKIFEDGYEALRQLLCAMIRHRELGSLAEEIIQAEHLRQG